MKRCHWVEFVPIAQVKFAEWTHDNQLRQPVFLGRLARSDARMANAHRCRGRTLLEHISVGRRGNLVPIARAD